MNNRIYSGGVLKLRNPERVSRMEVERVVEICLKEREINTLLDIGVGSGLFAEAFAKVGIIVSGIDINEEMIDAAKSYLPDNDFRLAPAENIPYTDNAFDASFFGLVFHEVSDYLKALSEARRVTRQLIFILEWQYKTEDFGPPVEHRIKPEFLKETALSAGYQHFTEIPLNTLILYILN
jgi:ubiquinone/menaquinone biosynthesis C-methylase UbiE